MVTRHEFLAELHDILRPRRYLETGVQYGTSLNLAVHSEVAVGVDPVPMAKATRNQQIITATSDDYFLYHMAPEDVIDFGFIDGSHLFEDALRDFINMELHSHRKTVIAFDDMLPYTHQMASRMMVPGHWTGDVWRVYPVLQLYRPDLTTHLVRTEPTGMLLVWGLNSKNDTLPTCYGQVMEDESKGTGVLGDAPVPRYIIDRETALLPEDALHELKKWLADVDG